MTARSCWPVTPTPGCRSRSGSTSPSRRRSTVDERWYRASGLRASVSHRVVFRRSARAGAVRAAGRPARAAVVRPRRAAYGGELGGDGRRRPGRRAGASWPPAGPGPAGAARRRADADRAADDRRLAATRRPGDGRGRTRASGGRAACPGRDRARVRGSCWTRPRAPAARIRSPPAASSTARGVTSSCFFCSTGSTRRWPPPAPARSTPAAEDAR